MGLRNWLSGRTPRSEAEIRRIPSALELYEELADLVRHERRIPPRLVRDLKQRGLADGYTADSTLGWQILEGGLPLRLLLTDPGLELRFLDRHFAQNCIMTLLRCRVPGEFSTARPVPRLQAVS